MKLDIKKLMPKHIKVPKVLVKNGPTIGMAVGLGGMGAALYFTAKDTPKALKALEEYEENEPEDISKVKHTFNIVKTLAYEYKRAIILFILSAITLSASYGTVTKRLSVATTAYEITDKTLRTYKEKVEEIVPDKKDEIEKAVKEEQMTEAIPKVIGYGDTLCYDPYTDSLIWLDWDDLRRAQLTINNRILYEDFVSLKDFYYEANVRLPGKLADEFGWNVPKAPTEDEFVIVKEDPQLWNLEHLNIPKELTKGERWAKIIDFETEPHYDFPWE